jgi:outer membrane protein
LTTFSLKKQAPPYLVNKKYRSLLLVLGFFFQILLLPHRVLAQEPIPVSKTLSLEEAVVLAFRENPTILSSSMQRVLDKFALEIAHNQFDFQYALSGSSIYSQSTSNGQTSSRNFASSLNPVLSIQSPIGTTYSLTLGNSYNYNNSSPGAYMPSLQLQIEQPLLRGSSKTIVQAGLNQAILSELSNRIGFEKTVAMQINAVLTQYRHVIKSEQAALIQKEAIKHDEKTIWEYNERIQAGQMAPASINEVKKNLFQDKLGLRNAENNLQIAKQTLLMTIGLDPHANIEISKDINIEGLKIPEEKSSIEQALKHNYDYQMSLIGLASKKINLHSALDSQRWKLNLTAQETTGPTNTLTDSRFQSLYNGREHSESVGLTLSVPIHDLSLQQAARSAQVQLEQTQLSLKQEKWQLESNVRTQIQTLESDKEEINLAKETLKYAKKNYTISKIKVDVGQSTAFELTSKATDLTNARQTLLNQEINFLNDFATLDTTLGNTLTRWHLQLPG